MNTYRIAGLIVTADDLPYSFQPFKINEPADADCTVLFENDLCAQKKILKAYDNKSFTVKKTEDDFWEYSPHAGKEYVKLIVNNDYSKVVCYSSECDDCDAYQEQLSFLLRIIFECRLIHSGAISLHSAAVEYCGEAIAFSGKSGIGKSTRASNWVNYLDAHWISGDRPTIRATKDNIMLFGVPWDGKEMLFNAVCYPLKAILEIRRARNTIVRRLSDDQLYAFLLKQCFIPMWDTETAATAIANIWYFAKRISIYRAFCGHLDTDAEKLKTILFERTNEILMNEKDLSIREGFKLRQVADEYMIIPVGDKIKSFGGAVVLNETSAFIFKQLEKGICREDLISLITSEYDVLEKTAAADLDELLTTLSENNILNS